MNALWGDIYEKGIQKIRLSSKESLQQLREFEQGLRQLSDLKMLWSGGSSEEGPIMVVSTEKPMDLVPILNELCMVESASKRDGAIVVRLKETSIA